jgi:low temperature requirement protein LtrA
MEAGLPQADRVTTLELFFDLVFVFTITQLTAVLYHDPSATSLAQVVLMLGVIWWMYGGYAWMTNAVSAHTAIRRLLLLGGMGGYFVLALSIPHAFSSSGLAFGLAYLVVVSVHSTLFARASSATVTSAILRLTPFNLASALLVVAGGAAGGSAQYALWALAFAFEWLTPVMRKPSGFAIGAAHFVERHGLVVLVAIGESVVAIGIGASHLPVDAALVGVALLGLALSACLWWLYFVGDDERAVAALESMPPIERAWAALAGFGYWHIPLLLGIVTVAAAERTAVAEPFEALDWTRAALLGGGIAVFLAGDVLFRRELGIGRLDLRAAAAALALATLPVGALAFPAAQIAALVALLAATIVAETRRDYAASVAVWSSEQTSRAVSTNARAAGER